MFIRSGTNVLYLFYPRDFAYTAKLPITNNKCYVGNKCDLFWLLENPDCIIRGIIVERYQ